MNKEKYTIPKEFHDKRIIKQFIELNKKGCQYYDSENKILRLIVEISKNITEYICDIQNEIINDTKKETMDFINNLKK